MSHCNSVVGLWCCAESWRLGQVMHNVLSIYVPYSLSGHDYLLINLVSSLSLSVGEAPILFYQRLQTSFQHFLRI